MAVAKSGLKHIDHDVERCLSLVRCQQFFGIISLQFLRLVFFYLMALRIQCVEERMRGLLSNIIRISKQVSLLFSSHACLDLIVPKSLHELLQRTDAEKCRNRTFITSDIRKEINEMNQKVKEEWEKKRAGEDKVMVCPALNIYLC